MLILLLYITLFVIRTSFTEFCDGDNTSKIVIQLIQTLQNKVLRILNSFTWKEFIVNNTLYQKHKILNVCDMFKFELRKFMFR